MAAHHEFIAFYFPDRETGYDKKFRSSFLGNFFPCEVRLRGKRFRTAEAAFHASKFWHVPEALRKLQDAVTGSEAFAVSKAFRDFADLTYGFGEARPRSGDASYEAMLEVLWAKFSSPRLAERLLETGDAFLLEHNEVVGRDDKWSDNGDGTGRNMLGEALMATRARLRGHAARDRPSVAMKAWSSRVREYASRVREEFGKASGAAEPPPRAPAPRPAQPRGSLPCAVLGRAGLLESDPPRNEPDCGPFLERGAPGAL